MEGNNYNNPGKAFAKYVSFNVLGMIGISCYILADTFFVAKGLASKGLAALNLAIPVFSLIHGLGLMIAMGSATKFSILRAMKEERKANQYFTQALYKIIFFSMLFILAGVFCSDQISQLCGADSDTISLTSIYLKTILCFTPMFCLNHLLICFVRNDGSPHLAMYATLAGSFANIIFDYIFIFPCNMGMFGAALATGMSPITGILVLSVYILKKKNAFHLQKAPFQLGVSFDTIRLGFSSFINELSSGVVIFVFNYIIMHLAGTIGVAAYGVVANIALVITSLFTGIGQGVQPLISHYYGVGDTEKMKQTYRRGIITALSLAAISYVIVVVFREPLIAVFNEEQNQQLASIANLGLVLYALGFFPSGINVVSAFFMTAKEQASNGMAISIARGLIFIVLFAVVLSMLFSMTGVWLSFFCAEIATLIFVICLLRRENKIKL